MINFIIYEADKQYISLYEEVIHKFMLMSNNSYRIYKYEKYSEQIVNNISQLNGYNIYILEIDVKGKSGLDFARQIRLTTDFVNNQIILISSHTDLVANAYHKKLLMLDFLSKHDDLENSLYICIKESCMLFNRNKALSIKCDGEILRIPHNDILYIEKSKNDNYICIHTESCEYKYKSNIRDIESHLKRDVCFLRSHRSAIVNVNKITKVDTINNVIYFNSKRTNYLSRDRKKDLEQQMEFVDRLI